MHLLDPSEVETWKDYSTSGSAKANRYIVPDHIGTTCPHCEREDAVLKYLSSREIQLENREGDIEKTKHYSVLGKAQCNRCKQNSDIILHGYKKEQGLDPVDRWLEIWIHPKPIDATSKAPDGTPDEYAKDYREAVEVLGISPNASAALARRGLERVLAHHYEIQAKNLEDCISQAIKQKSVPSELADIIDAARTLGNHGAHPLNNGHSGEIVETTKEEVLLSLEILRDVLDYAFARTERKKKEKAKLAEKYKLKG